MKLKSLSLLIGTTLATSVFACTTILVGNQATSDGSYFVARNVDFSSMNDAHYFYHPAKTNQKGSFHSNYNNFTYPLPTKSLGFSSFAESQTHDTSFGDAGFNDLGVGMSGTESIYNSVAALKVDPYVTKTGINEDSMVYVVLPRMHSAKEGVEILGHIIETQGAAEGFGVAFVDKTGIWYLETGSGHQWMAQKIPNNQYFVTGNEGRLQEFKQNDSSEFLASPTLIKFAEDHGLYNHSATNQFNFHKAYFEETENDKTYNYPRVYGLQHKFSPNINTTMNNVSAWPVFAKPTQKMTLADVEKGLRYSFQGTKHDPYVNNNPKEPYRPVSLFRTYESHILQVRPNLPTPIGNITYIGFGMTGLTPYLPFYSGAKIPPIYKTGQSTEADSTSAYWRFRRVQTLAMSDYNAYAPMVQKAYAKLEKKQQEMMAKVEKQYLETYQSNPQKAQVLLDDFEQKITENALATADSLMNAMITQMTKSTEKTYLFEGA